MTPQQVAISSAPAIMQGLDETENPAGFWLELFAELQSFSEATLGQKAAQNVINTLASLRGSKLN